MNGGPGRSGKRGADLKPDVIAWLLRLIHAATPRPEMERLTGVPRKTIDKVRARYIRPEDRPSRTAVHRAGLAFKLKATGVPVAQIAEPARMRPTAPSPYLRAALDGERHRVPEATLAFTLAQLERDRGGGSVEVSRMTDVLTASLKATAEHDLDPENPGRPVVAALPDRMTEEEFAAVAPVLLRLVLSRRTKRGPT